MLRLSAHCHSHRLYLAAPSLESGPLPDIQPGAMPQLRSLSLQFNSLAAALPPSWGSSPGVLPLLQELRLKLRVQLPLPASWAGGFCRLRKLEVSLAASVPLAAAGGQGHHHRLPEEWAGGFPQLEELSLVNLDLEGTIPASWLGGTAFPQLTGL